MLYQRRVHGKQAEKLAGIVFGAFRLRKLMTDSSGRRDPSSAIHAQPAADAQRNDQSGRVALCKSVLKKTQIPPIRGIFPLWFFLSFG